MASHEMNPLDLTTLRKLAEVAKPLRPGPWRLYLPHAEGSWVVLAGKRDTVCNSGYGREVPAYIAATDPTTIVALLDRLEAVEMEQIKLKKLYQQMCGDRDHERERANEWLAQLHDLRRSRPINVPDLAARLDGIRAEAAKGATPATLASMVEAVTYDLLPAPTGTGALIAARDAEVERGRVVKVERSCFTCRHAKGALCMLLVGRGDNPMRDVYAYCALSGVDEAYDNMPTDRTIVCPGHAPKESTAGP